MSIYDAAHALQGRRACRWSIFAGKEYGTGSSRDWAAKGTKLLGVRAVVAESFERIHRSNLVGMGVCRWCSRASTSWQSLGLKGDETVTIQGLAERPEAAPDAGRRDHLADGTVQTACRCICRIDTLDELEYFRNGGILPYVLR